LPTDNLRQFVAFTGLSYYTPSAVGKVANQNLHSLSNKDFIIIAYPDFVQEAEQLAAYHENTDGLSTVVVTTDQIFNEFSSGAQDVSAIRDFVKMFYDKASSAAELPNYLLLFGDGSYDPKHRFSSNTNFITSYQSINSTVVTDSYVSDDFFGLLDDSEGLWAGDAVDIGIGRFPVKSKLEAQTAVNKVINYKKTGGVSTATNSGSTFGNWRNVLCFIGDDEDTNLHISDADKLATFVDTMYGDYNVDKIYLDAYLQETKPGGSRYPGVIEAINRRIDQGALVINYTGHGGELGLAHERIVDVSQINKWSNSDKLFLFYTASCEVSRYDDPERTSAGEYAFLNPNGGAIALFSTVRIVYANPNFYLNRDFWKATFVPINGKMPRLGDLYKYSKTQPGGNSVNSRNFTLLGDPALTLAYPKYDIATDSINTVAVAANSSDTLKALSFVTVSGHVKDGNGNLNSTFNGVLYPTVYDKSQAITTLSNDGTNVSPPFTFKLQKNILYNGKVSVSNGMFKFSFIVPKDIAYNYGIGRISYYSDNGEEDANGYYEKIVIGGSNNSPVADLVGPEAHLYLNDTKFVFGGLTNENPYLYSILKDANGINTVGNGIGHDITAVLDGSNEKVTVLNEYYQADLNSYKSGTIRYPYTDLTEGKHTLKFKAWDVYNNSSECYTEFVVAKSAQLALSHVLNYPNPFTTRTQFYFEHNQSSNLLDVEVQIFTIAGKLVKTINKIVGTGGYRSDPMEWDGRDDFGDKIGRGVYVYRIKVKTNDGSTAEKYEKLVILN
jgi:Peptidase family C25